MPLDAGATSLGAAARALCPSLGTHGEAFPFGDGGPAVVSICSMHECAIPCLPSPAPWGAPRTSPTVAEAPPVAVLWHSCRLPLWPARPPGCCPSSGRRCGLLVLIPLGGISPTDALLRPHRPTTAAPSVGDASAAPVVSLLTPLRSCVVRLLYRPRPYVSDVLYHIPPQHHTH